MKDWIKNLKIGDRVICDYCGGWQTKAYVSEVQAITPKGFIKVNGVLFKPETGSARGDWHYSIREYTEEEAEEIKRHETVQKAFRVMKKTTEMSYNQALQVLEIFREGENA